MVATLKKKKTQRSMSQKENLTLIRLRIFRVVFSGRGGGQFDHI